MQSSNCIVINYTYNFVLKPFLDVTNNTRKLKSWFDSSIVTEEFVLIGNQHQSLAQNPNVSAHVDNFERSNMSRNVRFLIRNSSG